jgi:TPR repeat protein
VKQTATDCEILGGQYILFDISIPKTALAVWMSAAEAGDPTAQTYVGEIHQRGLVGAPDYDAAARWYRKAADQGFPRAQLRLGALYEKGFGVDKDPVQALNWYRKSAGLSKDRVVYLSQALAAASPRPKPESPRVLDMGKAKSQVEEIRAERKSSDQQVLSKQETKKGMTKRLLDQQVHLTLSTKKRLIDQTVALESASTRRDGLKAIEQLGEAVVAQR